MYSAEFSQDMMLVSSSSLEPCDGSDIVGYAIARTRFIEGSMMGIDAAAITVVQYEAYLLHRGRTEDLIKAIVQVISWQYCKRQRNKHRIYDILSITHLSCKTHIIDPVCEKPNHIVLQAV